MHHLHRPASNLAHLCFDPGTAEPAWSEARRLAHNLERLLVLYQFRHELCAPRNDVGGLVPERVGGPDVLLLEAAEDDEPAAGGARDDVGRDVGAPRAAVLADVRGAHDDDLAARGVHVWVLDAGQRAGREAGAVEHGAGFGPGVAGGVVEVGELSAHKGDAVGGEVVAQEGDELGRVEVERRVLDAEDGAGGERGGGQDGEVGQVGLDGCEFGGGGGCVCPVLGVGQALEAGGEAELVKEGGEGDVRLLVVAEGLRV